MKIFNNPDAYTLTELLRRPKANSSAIKATVQLIIKDVESKGDAALLKYNKQFDGVDITQLKVTPAEIESSSAAVPDNLKSAIQQAKKNIETFHLSQKEPIIKIETMPGVYCWRKSIAIEKIGLYIPGGTAPLFSTVLMLAIPAIIAGCKDIILCTPPKPDGTIPKEILYTAAICGITKIFRCGGAQAIAAMAYGTATIPKVYKILGPGNRYVTKAKQLLQHKVAIDMPAGPSELMVIADETANATFVAADLLAQAEHGADSQVLLVTTSLKLAFNVQQEIALQLNILPRKDIISSALLNSKIIVVKTKEDALNICNYYSPEHLIICFSNALDIAEKIINAGSVFIGNYSPESAGDYASGTNHTLPTNGNAAMYSGVSVDSYVKKITFQELTKDGLTAIANTVTTMATAEGLQAHSNAVKIRLNT